VQKGETFQLIYVIKIVSLLFSLKVPADHLVERHGPQLHKSYSKLILLNLSDGILVIVADISRGFPQSLQKYAGAITIPRFHYDHFLAKPFNL
jgi:hypothetical protein